MKREKRYEILAVMTACWAFEGGIEKVNQSLLRFWQNDNRISSVTLLVLHDRSKQIEEQLKQFHFDKIKAYGFDGNKAKFAASFFYHFFWKNPNLVYFGHIHLIPLWIFLPLWTKTSVMMIYGIEVWRNPSWLSQVALSRINTIISISEFTKIKALGYCETYSRALACHLGIPQPIGCRDHVHADKSEWAKKQGTILCVGRMNADEGYKGQDALIRAMTLVKERFPESVLVLVGRGSGVEKLKQLANVLGVGNHVYFSGYVSDEDLPCYYKSCDVFAMPSRGEGFGLVYLEAMAHGKPCIGSTVDAAGEVIVHGETGFLVDPENIQELAERIMQLLQDQQLRESMGQRGRQRFERLFTEEAFHSRLKPLFIVENTIVGSDNV